MALKLILAAATLAFATPILAQVPELTLGGPVSIERLPERLLKEPGIASRAALIAAELAAGDLTLDRAVFTVGPAGATPATVHLVVRKLELRHSAIVTNGNRLVIHAHQIVGDADSRITAFDSARSGSAPVPNGALDGVTGRPGLSAGNVDLFLTGTAGIGGGGVIVELTGQDGESGTDGRPGAAGAAGGRGTNARARWGMCRRGQGRGGNGGNGGDGGRGGDAGAGGDGGTLGVTFYNVPIETSGVRYDVAAGESGRAGSGGAGGAGGAGGPPGKNTNPCTALDALFGLPAGHGSNGAAGQKGADGQAAKNGKVGQFTAQRVELPM